METDTLEKTDTEQTVESKFCHLRHNLCRSVLSLCGEAFKPFTHTGDLIFAGYWRTKHCNSCDKPICPKCIEQDTLICPRCGEDRS